MARSYFTAIFFAAILAFSPVLGSKVLNISIEKDYIRNYDLHVNDDYTVHALVLDEQELMDALQASIDKSGEASYKYLMKHQPETYQVALTNEEEGDRQLAVETLLKKSIEPMRENLKGVDTVRLFLPSVEHTYAMMNHGTEHDLVNYVKSLIPVKNVEILDYWMGAGTGEFAAILFANPDRVTDLLGGHGVNTVIEVDLNTPITAKRYTLGTGAEKIPLRNLDWYADKPEMKTQRQIKQVVTMRGVSNTMKSLQKDVEEFDWASEHKEAPPKNFDKFFNKFISVLSANNQDPLPKIIIVEGYYAKYMPSDIVTSPGDHVIIVNNEYLKDRPTIQEFAPFLSHINLEELMKNQGAAAPAN